MLGAPCSPCCGKCPADGRPRTDPVTEGTWSPPQGEWPDVLRNGVAFIRHGGIIDSVNWSFSTRETAGPGNTWFFYGSPSSSNANGNATTLEQQDWGNLCNWYSAKATAPPAEIQGPLYTGPTGTLQRALTSRATRLPDETAIVHIYTPITTINTGPRTVRNAFFWGQGTTFYRTSAELDVECTDILPGLTSHTCRAVFCNHSNLGAVRGGVAFIGTLSNECGNGGNASAPDYTDSDGMVFGGAFFSGNVVNRAHVEGQSLFYGQRANNGRQVIEATSVTQATAGFGVVSGGAVFWGGVNAGGTVNGGAVFRDWAPGRLPTLPGRGPAANGSVLFPPVSRSGVVNGGALFLDDSANATGFVYDGAVFEGTSRNDSGVVWGGAIFRGGSTNRGGVLGGAEFFDNSRNSSIDVNGGATFNDASCSTRLVGQAAQPCPQRWAAHPTELPTCSGTAQSYCSDTNATCGCG